MTIARIFKVGQPTSRRAGWSDVIIVLGLFAVIYGGIRLGLRAPAEIQGPTISLVPSALPRYAVFSVGRMTAAYALSLTFALVYGYLAASSPSAERILMPLLDILQSVPILSFLPVVLLGLSAFLPQGLAAELASIVLIFTSQAWNMTFAWYQSLTTTPKELREASSIFRLNGWLRFRMLSLPFGMISLIWNSMMSWGGGWFFLMAAETFTVGQRDFRLPGLGSYLQAAASEGNLQAVTWGVGTLVLVIVVLDQLVWRPLLVWSERFKLEMVESDNPPASWFYDLLSRSRLIDWLGEHISSPLGETMDRLLGRLFPAPLSPEASNGRRRSWAAYAAGALIGLALLYAAYKGGQMLVTVPLPHWGIIGLGLLGTLIRVTFALIIALAWTIPVGVLIGTSPRLSAILQPLVQIAASVPATALFPILLLAVLQLPGGLNVAAVLLMLMGTQWYLLFNVIAGAAAIPQDLKYTATLMGLNKWERWRTLILPALFPYIVTGAITASGGAWNASIVAEYVEFGGRALQTVGIGSVIAQATEAGDYPLLLAGTLSMILMVVLINRLLWRRLFRLAEEQYRME
jgi:NitT/TauT family transport system permease protein